MKIKIILILSILSTVLLLLFGLAYWLGFKGIKLFLITLLVSLIVTLAVEFVIYFVSKKIASKEKKQNKTNELKKLLKHSLNKVIKRINKKALFIWRTQKRGYHVPWLLFIGFDKTNKESLLEALHSVNLNNELNLNELVAEYGCRWNLTSSAMCLDISEKLVLQNDADLETDVRKLWSYFLKLIKRYRYKKTVTGIVLIINVADFQKSTNDEIKQHGQTLYQRLHEIYLAFNKVLPVHILFTECDSMLGYNEFYSASTVEDHWSTLGFTVRYCEDKECHAEFFASYDQLIARINGQLFARLHQSDLAESAYPIFSYPLQIVQLKQKLMVLFTQLQSPSHSHAFLFIRSCYFTMTQPRAHLFDFFGAEVANQFGLPMNPLLQHKSKENKLLVMYDRFIKKIVSTSNLEWFTRTGQRKKRAIKISSYCVLILFFCGTTYSLYSRYMQNQATLKQFINTVDDYQVQLMHRNDLMPLAEHRLIKAEMLELLHNAYNSLDKPRLIQWGFYPGNKIIGVTTQLYDNELVRNFLVTLIQQSQAQLRQNQEANLETFENFVTYLMLGNPKCMDKDFVTAWFAAYWEKTVQNRSVIHRMNHQLVHLLNLNLPKTKLDQVLVHETQMKLKHISFDEYFYSYVMNQAKNKLNEPFYLSTSSDFDFGKIFGKNAYQLSVHALYTDKGYHAFETSVSNLNQYMPFTDCVLNDNTRKDFSISELSKQIDTIYFREYGTVWQHAVHNLNIVPFNGLKNAAAKLDIIADATTSPLLHVLNLINKNTNSSSIQQNKNSTVLISAFAALNTLVNNETAGVKRPIHEIMEQLKKLDLLLKSMNNAENSDKVAFLFAVKYMQNGTNDIFTNLVQQAQQVPEPLQHWLNQIAVYSWQSILDSAMNYIDTQWQNKVWSFYSSVVASKYPFTDNDNQISIADFSYFFCDNGVFFNFWKTYLDPFLSTDTTQLTLKSQLQSSLPISTSVLNQYQSVMQIHNAFCKNSSLAQIQLPLDTMSLGNNSGYSQLTTNGHSFVYRHGPIVRNRIQWPGHSNFNETSLKLYALNGQSAVITGSGVWGLFKLFQQAHQVVYNKETSAWVFGFNLEKQSVNYAVQTDNEMHPLAPGFFTQLKLGKRLARNEQSDQIQS